jgi:hypothetical protein
MVGDYGFRVPEMNPKRGPERGPIEGSEYDPFGVRI